MKENNTNKIKALRHFEQDLNSLLIELRDRAMRQMEHNLTNNVPSGIMKLEDTARHAVDHAIVSACSKRNEFRIEETRQLAACLLEDVNDHKLATVLFEAAKDGSTY